MSFYAVEYFLNGEGELDFKQSLRLNGFLIRIGYYGNTNQARFKKNVGYGNKILY